VKPLRHWPEPKSANSGWRQPYSRSLLIEVSAFVEKIASKKGTDRSSVLNELLGGDIKLAEAME
jgi:hypothetical protein